MKAENIIWGTSFSETHAEAMGLDFRKSYIDILKELKPGHIRLIAYWNRIEAEPDEFNFENLDFFIREAERHGIPYTITVGRKVPRYPEYFIPKWARELPEDERFDALKNYLEAIIARYDSRPFLKMWQVENEIHVMTFGDDA